MKKILLCSVLTLCYWSVFSQGSISGTITDAKTKEAIIGANVIIQGTTTGAQTDVEGKFLIANIKAGTYNLQVSFITYKTHLIPDVLVEDGKRITIDVPLSEEVSELKEVVVSGTRHTNTDYEMVRSMKEAKVIVVGVTSEQIAKTLDRDASQVLRRVPGVTIRNDQFVQIRGLSERYNAVMLHNAYAPSVETDIRSFSFATLPSNQIDRMLIFKSPAADLPGDFAGGVVKVFTKSIPDENNLTLDYSTQVRAGTTFQNYQYQQKDPNHVTGLNNGYYDLPASLPADLATLSDAQRTNAANSLKNLWTAQSGTAMPDQRLNLTFTKKFYLGKVQIGNISAVTYSNAFGTYNIKRGDFTTTGGVATSVNNFQDVQYNQQIRTGFLFNWAFKFSPSHLIEFKNLYNNSSSDQYVYREGQEGSSIKGGSLDKIYRGIYSGQLMGTHKLFNSKTMVEWVAGYNDSNRDQPDFKKYRYTVSQGNPDQLFISNVANPNYLGRFFAKLHETSTTGGISVKQQLGFAKDASLNPEIKIGGFYESKSRDFGARNIGYINGTNPSTTAAVQILPIGQVFDPLYTTTGIKISEDTKRKDSYTASNSLLAGYLMASIPFTTKLRLDAGVRVEDNRQKLDSYDDLHSVPANVNNSVTRWLPSANLSYNFTQKMLVRGAYGQTLNRPEFRELAPFSFYDYNLNFVFTGNQFIKTAQIQNVDVRWEYYPNKGELITAGAFYKSFANPIEVIANPNNGGVREATFDNPSSAMAYGIEVEVKKSLANVSSSQLLSKISLMFNASFIRSGITLRSDQAYGQRSDRPLQGQAPYVFNTGIFYNNENNGWQINLLHNVVGKSIFIVGNNYYADVYLMPRNVIDLTFSKKIGDRFQIRGGVSDILNQPILLLQDGNNGHVKYSAQSDGHIQDYRPGQVFSIGFSAKLNK